MGYSIVLGSQDGFRVPGHGVQHSPGDAGQIWGFQDMGYSTALGSQERFGVPGHGVQHSPGVTGEIWGSRTWGTAQPWGHRRDLGFQDMGYGTALGMLGRSGGQDMGYSTVVGSQERFGVPGHGVQHSSGVTGQIWGSRTWGTAHPGVTGWIWDSRTWGTAQPQGPGLWDGHCPVHRTAPHPCVPPHSIPRAPPPRSAAACSHFHPLDPQGGDKRTPCGHRHGGPGLLGPDSSQQRPYWDLSRACPKVPRGWRFVLGPPGPGQALQEEEEEEEEEEDALAQAVTLLPGRRPRAPDVELRARLCREPPSLPVWQPPRPAAAPSPPAAVPPGASLDHPSGPTTGEELPRHLVQLGPDPAVEIC
ncbi:uncharacterized protein ACIBXB_020995 [Morphnus guianensis]